MKSLISAAAVSLALSAPAFAGGFAPAVEPVVVVQPEAAPSSSMQIIVPVIAVALIALAVSGNSDDSTGEEDGEAVAALR